MMRTKTKSTLNCNFLAGRRNCGCSLVLAKDLQRDYENLDSACVESTGCSVVAAGAGEEPSSSCRVVEVAAVVVVGTSSVAVGTSCVVVVVELVVPIVHWLEVLCCWTLQKDLVVVGYNDQKGCSVHQWRLRHVHNLHFGVEVVFSHFHLHTDCPITGYQNHRPGLIIKEAKRTVLIFFCIISGCNL